MKNSYDLKNATKEAFKLIKKKSLIIKSYYLVHVQLLLIVLKILSKEVFILIN